MSTYIRMPQERVRSEAAGMQAPVPTLTDRIAALLGDAASTTIPDLQRALDADARAIGAALRELGFRRRRVWSGEGYALTSWRKAASD
jgi:hypothetical protein